MTILGRQPAFWIGLIATVHRPGDFVDMTLNGHDDVVEGWFRVVGPGLSSTQRCGVERPLRAQFMVQNYGTYKVTFTDGKNDLATAELDIERDDLERDANGNVVHDEHGYIGEGYLGDRVVTEDVLTGDVKE